MRSTGFIAIALGVLASTAYSAPIGLSERSAQLGQACSSDSPCPSRKVRSINGLMSRGPQIDLGPTLESPSPPAGSGEKLKARTAQLGAIRPDNNGGSALPQASPPSLKKRVAQSGRIEPGNDGPGAPSAPGLKARHPQDQRPVDQNRGDSNRIPSPTNNLNSRAPQSKGRVEVGDNGGETYRAQNPPALKARSPQGKQLIKNGGGDTSRAQNPPSLRVPSS